MDRLAEAWQFIGKENERARNPRCKQHQHQGRQQAAHPSGKERTEVDGVMLAKFGYQQTGDQEAGYHEKYIDADETAGKSGNSDVVCHDRRDGNRTQPINERKVLHCYSFSMRSRSAV